MGDLQTVSTIAAIWCDVLGIDSVGPEDDFFALGGESLAAVEMLAVVEERLGRPVSFIDFIEASTVADVAAAVEQARTDGAPSGLGPQAAAALDSARCSYGQEGLWFLELGGAAGVYNEPIALSLGGPVDPDALEHGLRTIVRRHASLRTTFTSEDGRPVPVVAAELTPVLDRIDLSRHSSPAAEAERLVGEFSRSPFDLERGPLVRAQLLALGDDRYILGLVLHHIVSDGWSHDLMLRELGELYRARRESREPDLPELTLGYGDFVAAQRDQLQGERLAAERDFWRAQLAGAPIVLRLPIDRRRPAVQTFAGQSHRLPLDAEVAAGVRELTRATRVTPYVLLLATFATLLYRRSGQDDLLISGPMANRDAGFNDVIGFFANTVVVRARLGGNPPFAALLSRVRESVFASFEHQHVPLDVVVDAMRPPRDPGINPLVQVNFRVRTGPLPTPALGDVAVRRLPIDLGVARFELSLELRVREDGIEAEWGWNSALLDHSTILRLAAEFEGVLRQVIAAPQTRLLAFELPDEPAAADTGESDQAKVTAPGGIRGFRTTSGRSRGR